jgi:branched-chain amino acid aminotransferase
VATSEPTTLNLDASGPLEVGCWLDGSWVRSAGIPLLSCGALYGASVFDSCRAWRASDCARIYGLRQHLARLHRSADLATLTLRAGDEELVRGIAAVLRPCRPRSFVRVRILAFGVDPEICSQPASVAIMALPVEGYAPQRPRLRTATSRRRTSGELPRALKSPAAYLPVRREIAAARAAGYDDAVIVNEHGRVSEASRSNIVMLRRDVLATPPVSEGALPGVTKKILRHIAQQEHLDWESRPIERRELEQADAILLTSSSLGVVVVRSIDGREFPDNKLASFLCTRYEQLPQERPNDKFIGTIPLDFGLAYHEGR